jgi:choline dehydrogenase-like flavoprotein
MMKAAAKLNLTVTPNVAAIITSPHNGRSACINCGMCSGYGCQVKARSSSAVALLPYAVATGNCEIRVNSYVREITVDAAGRATGVTYFDKANNNREGLPESQMRGAQRQRHRNSALAADVQVQPLPAGPGQFQRHRRQVSDDRQWRRRVRSLRRSA